MITERVEKIVLFGPPVALLVVSFVAICFQQGTFWPWTRVLHEDGQHTLLGTVFYFEHATRELPLDLLLGAFIGGSVRFFYPAGRPIPADASTTRSRLLRRFAVGTVAVVLLILGGATLTAGVRAVLDNLAQIHTRLGAEMVWGAHWRYHLLERLGTMFLAFFIVGIHWVLSGRPPRIHARSGIPPFGATLVVFGTLTLLFQPTWEPFREPMFLGHQARELFTHTLVTLPLALGMCFWLGRKVSAVGGAVSAKGMASWPVQHDWPLYVSGACSVFLGLYLAIAVLFTKAHTMGQSESFVTLICSHFLEHSFTYLVVPLVAGLCYLLIDP